MLVLSLLLNVVVLVPVVAGLTTGATWAARAYGTPSPARSILLAVYLAILGGSVALLLILAVVGPGAALLGAAIALLALQIVYKVLTVATVRDRLRNPVVASNLAIAVVHAVTLATIVLPLLD